LPLTAEMRGPATTTKGLPKEGRGGETEEEGEERKMTRR